MTVKEFRSLFKGTIEICYGGYLALAFCYMAYVDVKNGGHSPSGLAAEIWNGLMIAAFFYTVLYYVTGIFSKKEAT
jgi:hypothetical protein